MQDLDWEDRERVLRLLFSKMNTGEPASKWREVDKTQNGSSSHQGTAQLNQSFREENEEFDED